ncbi:MAG: MIP family channel protein [Planctomycetota bacterium]
MNPKLSDVARRSLAEAIGTFILVFCGTGAIVVNDVSQGAITHVGIALTFGLVVLALIYALGHISGCHLNRAVTIGLWTAGRFPRKELVPYIAGQCAGALLASIFLRAMFPLHQTLGATLPTYGSMQSFVLELVLTWILMLVILCVSISPEHQGALAGLAIGAVIGFEALFAGPISGASMNPARSLAPALISMHFEHCWVYLSAPFLGSIAAVWIFSILKNPAVEADSVQP